MAKKVMGKSGLNVTVSTNFAVGIVGNTRAVIRVAGEYTQEDPGDTWIIATAGNDSLALEHHLEKYIQNPSTTTLFTPTPNSATYTPNLWVDILNADCGIPGATLLQVTPQKMEEAGMLDVYYKPSKDSSGVGGFARCRTLNSTIGVLVMGRPGCGQMTGNRWILVGGGDDGAVMVKKFKNKLASIKWL